MRHTFPKAPYVDLLDGETFTELLASPSRIERRIPKGTKWVVVDEVQRAPDLLNEAHRLIEERKIHFVLTGSSARKLRRGPANLLAGRAYTMRMHALTCKELGKAFDIRHSLRFGQLPAAYVDRNPRKFLQSYVQMYLREEVQAEGLTRNLSAFARFLEAISFSQGSPLNLSSVARDCHVERKVVEDYVTILEDLLLATRVPVFTRRAKRKMATHTKFYFFDAGVYRAIRPKGPLDSADEIDGPALETLLLQELRAHNDYGELGYDVFHWRSITGEEVDFVLYGERGLLGFEVKRADRVRDRDLDGIQAFLSDYPMARTFLVYGGTRTYTDGPVTVLPLEACLRRLPVLLSKPGG